MLVCDLNIYFAIFMHRAGRTLPDLPEIAVFNPVISLAEYHKKI